jgi:hypothetical protein
MIFTKKQILDAVIEAHEFEKRRSAQAAETFKNSETFPQVTEEELNKIARIEKALEKLRSFSASPAKNATQVREGLVLRASNSLYGEQFYFFLKESELRFVSITSRNKKTDIRVVDADHFRPSKVGEIAIYQHGRPGEEFEVRLQALEIY